jgi:hypothetical protein
MPVAVVTAIVAMAVPATIVVPVAAVFRVSAVRTPGR